MRHVSICLLALAFSPVAAAETSALAGRPASDFPKPDRPVAEIISPRWASDNERDKVDEVGQVARLLNVTPGETVADIGAGSGYYATRLSALVGRDGRVLAEDVTPLYLADLRVRVRRLGLANVTVVKGEPHDPRLPARSVDVAVLVHMYHEISQPFGLLWNLAGAMKPGGRIGIVDADDIPSRHGTPPGLLSCELSAVGYRQINITTLAGGVGYLFVFKAPEPIDLPDPASIRPCRDQATRR